MKLLILAFVFSLSTLAATSEQKCEMPQGKYTDLEMVLNQFVLGNGNPNWGDWCYEGEPSDSKPCNDELDQWDQWLVCTGLSQE